MSSNPTYDELVAATVEARELIREAHGVIKDLRQATREAQRMIRESDARDIRQEFNDVLTNDANGVLKTVYDAMDEAIRKFLEMVKDGPIPVRIACPNCRATVLIIDVDEPTPCPGCGHRIKALPVPVGTKPTEKGNDMSEET